MSICIFGGAFDPIHKGHIDIALSCLERFNFDKLLFMVSKKPPHKSSHKATFFHRYNMVKLVVKEMGNKFDVTDIEKNLDNLSYTFNSLTALKNIYKNDNLYFLVGSDIFASIEKWHNYKELFNLAHFIIGSRFGISFDDIINQMPNDIKKRIENEDKISLFQVDTPNISSSEIRENFKKYISFLPEAVAEYIKEHNLYENV